MATKKSTKKPAAPKHATKKTGLRKPTAAAKKTAPRKPKSTTASGDGKKLSAIDAAARIVSASKEPMSTRQMIEAMAAKNLWTSPGGKTPHATLYAAIHREIQTKGKDARFKKTERGKFAAAG